MFNLVMCTTGTEGGEMPKQRQTDVTALGASSEASVWVKTRITVALVSTTWCKVTNVLATISAFN
jgi:hypothetical protein